MIQQFGINNILRYNEYYLFMYEKYKDIESEKKTRLSRSLIIKHSTQPRLLRGHLFSYYFLLILQAFVIDQYSCLLFISEVHQNFPK